MIQMITREDWWCGIIMLAVLFVVASGVFLYLEYKDCRDYTNAGASVVLPDDTRGTVVYAEGRTLFVRYKIANGTYKIAQFDKEELIFIQYE